MIEDESPATDFRARKNFGAQIKQITACDTQSNHGKNLAAFAMTPFWRLSITVNDEPEKPMVLPPIDESMEDKLILLKAVRQDMPMPTGTPDEKTAFWDALMAELPAFVHWLLDWENPTANVLPEIWSRPLPQSRIAPRHRRFGGRNETPRTYRHVEIYAQRIRKVDRVGRDSRAASS